MAISDIEKIEIKTVKQISNEMKNLLEETYPYIWIQGEIGAIKLHSSGHKYFSLKEDDCVINAICWRGTALSSNLQEGSIMQCYGRITLYAGRSSYQIIVKEAREINKQGNIFFQLEELKKKLTLEGLFDIAKKRKLPLFPENIGILTSPTGAVLHDIIHRITHRFPCCKIYFFPISVQGSESQESILNGLENAANMKDKLDLVILARGGGSVEDLWIFNDETITRKVAAFPIPVISAIGHETDTTLVDYAADLRAPTPTAAAEMAVPDKQSIKSTIDIIFNNDINTSNEKLKQAKSFLENYSDYNYIYQNALGSFGQKIDNLILVFLSNAQERLAQKKTELGALEPHDQIFNKFERQIEQYVSISNTIAKMRIEDTQNMLILNKTFLDEKESELKEKILICDKNNHKITCAKEIRLLDEFTLKFFDGNVQAMPKK